MPKSPEGGNYNPEVKKAPSHLSPTEAWEILGKKWPHLQQLEEGDDVRQTIYESMQGGEINDQQTIRAMIKAGYGDMVLHNIRTGLVKVEIDELVDLALGEGEVFFLITEFDRLDGLKESPSNLAKKLLEQDPSSVMRFWDEEKLKSLGFEIPNALYELFEKGKVDVFTMAEYIEHFPSVDQNRLFDGMIRKNQLRGAIANMPEYLLAKLSGLNRIREMFLREMSKKDFVLALHHHEGVDDPKNSSGAAKFVLSAVKMYEQSARNTASFMKYASWDEDNKVKKFDGSELTRDELEKIFEEAITSGSEEFIKELEEAASK